MSDSRPYTPADNMPIDLRSIEQEETARIAKVLQTVLVILFVASALSSLSLLQGAAPIRVGVIGGLLLTEIVAFVLLRRGLVRVSALLLCSVIWMLMAGALAFTGGVHGSANPVIIVIVLTAGLLLGGWAGVIFAVLSVLAGLLLLSAELNGTLPVSLIQPNSTTYWIYSSLAYLSSAGLLFIATRSLRDALGRARVNEVAQAQANRELEQARATLEQQVQERTSVLEQRTRYLQASFDVSHAAASILEIDELLQQSVELVREQFGLYYVGLFLLDTQGEWAVLQAGTGAAGKAMLERRHRIRVGAGMTGWCIANARPRIAQQATEDEVRLITPELPLTRSEAAIPLRSRGKVIGAINVQSETPNAFGELEISTFQALADQVALAIDNAQLLQESRRAIKEIQLAQGQVSRQAWFELLQMEKSLSVRYQAGGSEKSSYVSESGETVAAGTMSDGGDGYIDSRDLNSWPAEMRDAALSRRCVQVRSANQARLYAPIQVRQQVIGVINLLKGVPQLEAGVGSEVATSLVEWSTEEVELIESLCEQLGIALESARLYQSSQRLAAREQLTAQVTSRIRETLDMEMVLKSAVQEIQKALGVPEVVISLRAGAAGEQGGEATDESDEQPQIGAG